MPSDTILAVSEITPKNPQEIEIMAEGGKIAAQIRGELVKAARPGVMTLELDKLAAELMVRHGVKASFKGFQRYQYSIVTCLNEEVVHGIPSERKLREGDLLTIDLGVSHQGFHTDTAVTVEIQNQELKIKNQKLLHAGQKALARAIEECAPGNRVGDISHAIQDVIEAAGYSPIRAFVGHGIGRKLHESPQIPCVGFAGGGPLLKVGTTLAVEVMYARGGYEVGLLDDGWTTVTRDGSVSAMFEHTLAITDTKPKVLTLF